MKQSCFWCELPATKRIPYCKETAIGEYIPGLGEDLWFCDIHWADTYGIMTEEEALAFVVDKTEQELLQYSLEKANDILFPN
jgi:hypothetical protein